MQALQRAIELQEQGKLDKAERLYAGILASQPRCFEALHRLGVIHFRAARHAEALHCLKGAVGVRPTDVVAVTNLARLQAKLRLREDALANLERAVALKPDFAEAHLSRGEILRELRRRDEARASFARASSLRPNHAGTLVMLGVTLREVGRPAEALAAYDRALALEPKFVAAHNNRSNALADLKRCDEALAAADRALALAPDFAHAWTNRGNALRERGRPAEALAAYDRALALAPTMARGAEQSGARAVASRPCRRGSGELRAGNRVASPHGDCPRKPRRDPHRARSFRRGARSDRTSAAARSQKGPPLSPSRQRQTHDAGRPHLAAMRALLAAPDSLSRGERADLHFALGKALDDVGDREGSFLHLLEANAEQRKLTPYDEAATLACMRSFAAAFDADFLPRHAGEGDPSRNRFSSSACPARARAWPNRSWRAEAGGKVAAGAVTQVGRALAQLGVEHIAAYSPEARGRSERAFRTLRAACPRSWALAGVKSVEAADAFIREV